jgi:hypothetical protein
MTMSWATRRVRACTKIYATRMSTFSTMLMNPIVGVLQSLPATKSVMVYKRSHQDSYSADSRDSLRKGGGHTREVSRKGLELE